MKTPHSSSQQQGMALPTVMALSVLGSVLLIAQWQSLAMAESMGQRAQIRWQLEQHALQALLTSAEQLQRQGCQPATCQPLSGKLGTVAEWQTQSQWAHSVTLDEGIQRLVWLEAWPVQTPLPSADAAWVYRLTALVSNQQGQSLGWQAVWQPSAPVPSSAQPALQLGDFNRLLALSP
ncbi:MAG: hypothetical protein EBZ60_04835 [Betaproteobacteria bacterium]|nr:hypothetical protein [Betaproteobacteria bacterium]